ncbi:MAG TPA: GntR family transcriptional regulator [Solirubrobacteraceae bacterium]|nr:GntR family transcriptional regulator [Solirubrobacteraceae bacterium]
MPPSHRANGLPPLDPSPAAAHVPEARERRQLPEEVASYVRERIFSGELRPGEFLRIEPIAEALGVSATPVREGLLTLRSEAFVRLIPRRGFVVERFSRQDILDLFMVQADLAGELAARSATRFTPAQLEELAAIDAAHRRAMDTADASGTAYWGHAFHRAVNLGADSPRLANLLGSVVRHLPNRFYTAIEGQLNSIKHNHPLLLDAFAARDPEAAREIMRDHILDAGQHLVTSLEKRGLWNPASED